MIKENFTLSPEVRKAILQINNGCRIDNFEGCKVRHNIWKKFIGKIKDKPFIIKD